MRVPVKYVDVRPQYPAHLESAGVDGVVVLQGHIGTDGMIQEPLSCPRPILISAPPQLTR